MLRRQLGLESGDCFGGKVCMGPPFAVLWGGGAGLRAYNALVGWRGGLEATHGDFQGPRLALSCGGAAGSWPGAWGAGACRGVLGKRYIDRPWKGPGLRVAPSTGVGR